jgi:hypothetical protein
VLLNTQKHYRVIGDRNFADPYSSAATFDGFTRPPATFVEATPWAWAWVKPRTWLLGVGWRRQGLLDPADAPAPDLASPLEERDPGGLGWHLVRQLVDGLEYRAAPAGGNTYTLVKQFPAPAPGA